MTYKQNLHVHTNYCDGKNAPRDVVLAAIADGFDSIGFSGHSYMSYSPSHSMSLEGTEAYIREIRALQKEYEATFPIFCGIEYDMHSDIDLSPYDYAIGSVHYLHMGDEYVGFDRSADEVQRIINVYFHGDGMSYARSYYEALAQLPDYGRFDIIGHFDLIEKHRETNHFFDPTSKAYLSLAIEAAEQLAGRIPRFEVNTGAISRGYRTTPYPSIPLMKELKRLGFRALITSDCHDARDLSCGYDVARELLLHCGFSTHDVLTKQGFVEKAL